MGLVVNVILTSLKFLAGLMGNSSAMIADAVHSLSDLITDAVAIVAFKLAGRPKDETHDYGHGKFETLASVIVGLSLAGVAIAIFYCNIIKIWSTFKGESLPAPDTIALVAAVVSIVSKEWLFRYTQKVALNIKSSTLMAKAWDHRSDALSSIGTLVGIAGAIFIGGKGRILDPIAAIIVGGLILKVSIKISLDAIHELMEGALPESEKKRILEAIFSTEGVIDAHKLRTRRIGTSVGIDVHILVSPSLSVVEGHDIATAVEHKIREIHGHDAVISVHIEPIHEEVKEPGGKDSPKRN
nr:cation diffusion facilitator family transporter [Thermovirga lienii]